MSLLGRASSVPGAWRNRAGFCAVDALAQPAGTLDLAQRARLRALAARTKLAHDLVAAFADRYGAFPVQLIEAQMRDDPDWKDFIDIDWSKATIVYPVPKNAVSIRLDADVLDFFKATGKGYQTRINAVLRHYMQETLKGKKAG